MSLLESLGYLALRQLIPLKRSLSVFWYMLSYGASRKCFPFYYFAFCFKNTPLDMIHRSQNEERENCANGPQAGEIQLKENSLPARIVSCDSSILFLEQSNGTLALLKGITVFYRTTGRSPLAITICRGYLTQLHSVRIDSSPNRRISFMHLQ